MTDIHQLGTEQTRSWSIADGGQVEVETDIDQVLIKEMSGPDEIGMAVNHGPLSTDGAYKGKEITGPIRHLRFVNASGQTCGLTLNMIKGLAVRDRRLNLIGDALGVTEAIYSSFLPLAAVVIPAQSVAQLVAANAGRRQLYITNKPSNLREVYISAAAIDVPPVGLVNGDFETGDLTGWTQGPGTNSFAIADAATTANSDPRGGSYYARINTDTTGKVLRQDVDLLAQGFSASQIDAGDLTLNFGAWIGGEDGVNDGGNLEVDFLDDSLVSIDTDATSEVIPTAGLYQQHSLASAIPAGTRTMRLDVRLVTNAGGGTQAFVDDVTATIDGANPTDDELAAHIPPDARLVLPTTAAVYAFNPHSAAQTVLLGEVS